MYSGPYADPNAIAEAETCFTQAHQRCQSATLDYGISGTDTGSDYVFFSTTNSQQCGIALVATFTFASGGGRITRFNATCASLLAQGGGLQFNGCGSQGTITIPHLIRQADEVRIPCGFIAENDTPQVSAPDTDELHCFWHAYQHCQAQSLRFQQYIKGISYIWHTFNIQPSSGHCGLTDSAQPIMNHIGVPDGKGFSAALYVVHPCADIEQVTAGLLVRGCDQEGDIIIPAVM